MPLATVLRAVAARASIRRGTPDRGGSLVAEAHALAGAAEVPGRSSADASFPRGGGPRLTTSRAFAVGRAGARHRDGCAPHLGVELRRHGLQMVGLVERDRVAAAARQRPARLADSARSESPVIAADHERVRQPRPPHMPAMTARLALHPDSRTERPHREAKPTLTGTTHMKHAITVPRWWVRRKDPAQARSAPTTDPGVAADSAQGG